MQHELIIVFCITFLSAICQTQDESSWLGFHATTPHVCPLELIIQQSLQSPACLRQLGGDVHDWTPFLEGCWNRNLSKKKRVLTSIGNIQNDRGPGEVLLPPGPGPGILLLEGSSFENLICKYAHLQTTEPRRHFGRRKAPQSTSVT
jgi:hypothetical protein